MSQTIFRVSREERDKWTMVMTETLRDRNLSYRAVGLLAVMLSYPDDWRVHQEFFASLKQEGRDAVTTAFRELEAAGYLVKEIVRDKGRITGTIWHVYERPKVTADAEKPIAGEPKSDNPTLRSNVFNEGSCMSGDDIPFLLDTENNTSTGKEECEEKTQKKAKRNGVVTRAMRDAEAETLVNEFPKSGNRQRAIYFARRALAQMPFAELRAKVHAYAKAKEGTEKEFIASPENFFRNQQYLQDPSEWTPKFRQPQNGNGFPPAGKVGPPPKRYTAADHFAYQQKIADKGRTL